MEPGVVFNGPGDGFHIISMGWMRFNTTWGVEGGVGGLRYHTGIANVKLGKLRVALSCFLIMSDGGKRMGIVWIKNEPQ